ncbi:DUF1178 family protein [Aquisalinus flavus]|uniref:DUF1178 domain-containing protein n=1 Tax=Aquisalinus flavus TaxID=1526572 RepID=A0A8J2Y6K9_9PROT|nr:DUF1178 family protein [Aquisalinus flavus]MBD0427874.1 DUF1178 family protein [Aquisalinus flavus]UNE47637.1 DUF1178 family protein [Aquisalinus flavus]GGD04572.1 hypothetical protein GCM10011342_11910 [Aquisalinus flavus]
MIKYQLKCEHAHEFEGWFSNSADYDAQAEKGLLECPHCGSSGISKALMAPAIARSGSLSPSAKSDDRVAAFKRDYLQAARRARDYVEKNFDNVGKRFPEEARRIHYGEAPERGIFGEASPQEISELIDEGVEIAPLPDVRTPEEVKKKLN